MRSTAWLVLWLAACSSGSSSSPPPSRTAPPASVAPPTSVVEATPPPSTTTPPPTTAVARTPAERAHMQLRLLREARAAAAAHDYDTALERFDALIGIAPHAPRIVCESALVAHEAGHDELAAPRIELALRGFGPDDRLAPSLRVPVAMCLYNAGLVYQARGDREAAADAWDRSLRLRPNETVRQHRTALGAVTATVHDDSAAETVAGVRVDWDDDQAMVLHASDEAQLVRAMAQLFSGDTWDEDRNAAESRRIGALDLPAESRFTRALLFETNDQSVMLQNVSYVVALEQRAGGWILFATEAGFVDTQYNGSNDASDATLDAMTLDHGLIRIDFHLESSNETQMEFDWPGHPDAECMQSETTPTSVERSSILCALTSAQCVVFDVGESSTGEASSYVYCTDADGNEIDEPELEPTGAGADAAGYEARLTIADGPSVTLASVSGTHPQPALVGSHPWAAFVPLATVIDRVSAETDADLRQRQASQLDQEEIDEESE